MPVSVGVGVIVAVAVPVFVLVGGIVFVGILVFVGVLVIVGVWVRVGFRVDKIIYRGGYGKGVVGIAERLAPSWRPFFSLVATKHDGA